MIGIYKITSPNNKIYIGQSIDLKNREKTYSKNKAKSQRKLFNSIKKYGWENHAFEIIHELSNDINQDILNKYEIFYWKQYKNCGFSMLNIREPGSKGKLSNETKNKISKKSKGNKYALGYRHSKEELSKMKHRFLGFKNPMFGKKHSEKTKKILSNQRIGVKNSNYGKLSHFRKKVIDVDCNITYESILEASKHYKVTRKTIRDWIKRGYKLCYCD